MFSEHLKDRKVSLSSFRWILQLLQYCRATVLNQLTKATWLKQVRICTVVPGFERVTFYPSEILSICNIAWQYFFCIIACKHKTSKSTCVWLFQGSFHLLKITFCLPGSSDTLNHRNRWCFLYEHCQSS